MNGTLRGLAVLAVAMLMVGCADPAEPASSTLRIFVYVRGTSALAQDADGVDLRLDAQTPVHLNAVDSLRVAVARGDHVLELSDIEPNCTLVGSNPRPVSVGADSVTLVIFDGTCT